MPALAVGELDARKTAFLEAFPNHGTVSAACAAIGLLRQRVHEWCQPDHPAYDEDFVYRFGHAKEAAADAIEASLRAQALRGHTAWDTTAAIFLLKGYRPQFRDQYQVNVRQESVSISMDLSDLSAGDKLQLLQRLVNKQQSLVQLPEGKSIDAVPPPA